MRVLLVSHALAPDSLAGVELYTSNVAAELVRAGHQAEILTRRLTAKDAPASVDVERRADGVRVHRLLAPPFRSHPSGMRDRAREALATNVVREVRPDVVHATHLMHHSPWLVSSMKRHGIPVVLSLLDAFMLCPRAHLEDTQGRSCAGPRGGRECVMRCFAAEPARRRTLWLRRAEHFGRTLDRVDRLLAPSRFVAERFGPLLRDPSRLEVLPLGVFERPAAPLPGPDPARGALELAFVGTLVPHKGADRILDALAIARPGRVTLRLIGRAPDADFRARLERQASQLSGVSLVFVPSFEAGELHRHLSAVDAVIVPSRVDETFCLVAHEALAGGIPVLACNRGALPEIIEDGVNGRLFDPDDARALSDQILELSHSEALSRRLRAGAAATPIDGLSEHVSALVETYRRAIASRRVSSWRERAVDAWTRGVT